MLREESIEIQVCRNPDVKCADAEHAHRTVRDRPYQYFTHKNIFRYMDLLPKFVRAYNDTVQSTTGMAPSHVKDSDILSLCKMGLRMAEAFVWLTGLACVSARRRIFSRAWSRISQPKYIGLRKL